MRVLIACECSGHTREAFRRLGHDAWSCDTKPAEDNSRFHLQGDVTQYLDMGWDFMLGHPPCTDIAVSGALHFAEKIADGRQQKALDFVRLLMNAPIKYIAIENPVSVISSKIRKPDQIIQPYEYGHPESKKTCLWLKNLPRLVPTKILPLPERGYWDNQTPSHQNKLGPSKDRATIRSRTYEGISEAMATQWSAAIAQHELDEAANAQPSATVVADQLVFNF